MQAIRRTAMAAMTGLTLAGLTPLAASTEAEAMSGYRWKNRPLVVIAPGTGDPRLVRQRAIVSANRAGLSARDMVVVIVAGDQVSTDLGAGPGVSAATLRARYGVARGAFRAILIGKDGGVKISSAEPLSPATLFATIDAMPMRRDEIRQRGK